LRHTYAARRLGIAAEPVPLRLSAYSGKGIGYYATAGDGRPDWSEEFGGYIARVEGRTPRERELRFGYHELAAAMDALKFRFPKWYSVINALDVHGVRIEEYCLDAGADLTTVKRQRKKATFFLYEELRLNHADDDEELVACSIIRVI
jgi:hypothetical protein